MAWGTGRKPPRRRKWPAATLETYSYEPVISLLRRCHAALRHTRGAVISVASINATYDSMVWVGVGNVEGVILRARDNTTQTLEHIPLLPGVAGYQLPPLRAVVT